MNTGLAFVIIQHLAPNHETIMPELLQRKTKMKVELAGEGMRLQTNCIYLIPPNKSLTLHDGSFQLHNWLDTDRLRLPVDIFFHSLAQIQNEKSIGIVLSGMGADGTKGLISIKEKNGLALVQDAASAKFNGMPGSASEAVNVDIIAPANELPRLLLERLKYTTQPAIDNNAKEEREPEKAEKGKGSLDSIIQLLYQSSGHDFSSYKKSTISRRIERRKGIHNLDSIQQYLQFVKDNPDELTILFKELLIGVTNYFRDISLWNELSENIIPSLLVNLPPGQKFRVWVPACSTGEEAYSLAILLFEIKEKLNLQITIQIFATDLEADAIEKARRGFFPVNIENYVSQERLKRFFRSEPTGYLVSAQIREMIIFARQNVIKDPPFTKVNLLSCRNLLIYLEPAIQNKLLSLFKYSLVPGGILVLGSAETAGALIDLEVVNQKLKIFRRTPTDILYTPMDFPSFFKPGKTVDIKDKLLPKVTENIQTIADQILLQRFSPASILVNNNGDILYVTGRTGKYLEPAAGKANWNIYAMARDGLRQELPGAFRKVSRSYDAVILRSVKIQNEKDILLADVTLQRLDNPEAVKDMIIIIFSEVIFTENELKAQKPGKEISLKRQTELETELQRSYEELKITREEMQTSQEELRSINEELQSTNEELQSANEELTTSKEEMQSLNEELQTVNQELQSKVNDLLCTNDDMKNLLNSTEIATLFLDKNLNIRRFTDLVTNIFKIRFTDLGRPFTDLVTQLNYPEMDANAREVIKNLKTIERTINTKGGKWFNVRIMPYRTLEDKIDGLVITFSDITQSKKLEIELIKANEALSKAKAN